MGVIVDTTAGGASPCSDWSDVEDWKEKIGVPVASHGGFGNAVVAVGNKAMMDGVLAAYCGAFFEHFSSVKLV